MNYLDLHGNVMRDVIKLLEETNDGQQFDAGKSTPKENYSGTTGTTYSTRLGDTRPARESNDGRGEE